jgi:peptidoglycan/LPS O-acetylase OafA/YrhL
MFQKTISAEQSPHTIKLLLPELMRFIAAISVLIWHYQHFYYLAGEPVNFEKMQQPMYAFLKIFYEYGFYGVHVFWCISGFIFFWKYKEAIAEKRVKGRDFFLLRFSRLYPLHFVTLLMIAGMQAIYSHRSGSYFVYQFNDLKHFFLQIFLASNWGLESGYSYNGPIWSISVEVLVYLAFFLTVRYIANSVYVNLGVLLLCVAAKFFQIKNPFFDCLIFFYLGGLTVYVIEFVHKNNYAYYFNYMLLLVGLSLSIGFAVYGIYGNRLYPSLLIAAYTPILLCLSQKKVNSKSNFGSLIEIAGNSSYAVYLLHFPLQLLVVTICSYISVKIPTQSSIFFLSYVFVSLLLASMAYYFFEKPLQDYLRMRFRKI